MLSVATLCELNKRNGKGIEMRCISLWQPWASLMALDQKRIETRSFRTHHRGPLLIQAGKKWSRMQQGICNQFPYSEFVNGKDDLPLGAIVCVVNLTAVFPVEKIREKDQALLTRKATQEKLEFEVHGTKCPRPRDVYDDQVQRPFETVFGDYTDGRYGWLCEDVVRFEDPVPCTGKQGFFDVPVYTYQWGNNEKRRELKGRNCLVAARQEMNTRVVVWLDNGKTDVVSGNALRKVRAE